MNLPKVVADLVAAQNNQDSAAYTACFSETAVVHDEGKKHTGKNEIYLWIEHANKQYRSFMKPIRYEQSGSNGALTADVSGTFPGSPIVLQFHFGFEDDLIGSLKVTG